MFKLLAGILNKFGIVVQRKNGNKKSKSSFMSNEEFDKLTHAPRYLSSETVLFGNKMSIVDSPSYLSSLNEIFHEEIYKFQPAENEAITIIDCGANIGLATLYFKKNFPHATILSYEPDPKIFNALKKNVLSFNYADVEVFNEAVSVNEENIYFHQEGGHSGMISKNANEDNIITVKSIRLKSVLQKFESITFLKIDIEGHEVNVLPDITEELKKVKHLFLEYHSFLNQPQVLDELLALLKQAGFRYYLKEACNKKFPFIEREIFLGMDFLVNIFCYRP